MHQGYQKGDRGVLKCTEALRGWKFTRLSREVTGGWKFTRAIRGVTEG